MPNPILFQGLTAEQAQATADVHRANGATAEIVPGQGGLFTVKVTLAAAAGTNADQARAGAPAQAGANADNAQAGANAADQAQATNTSLPVLSRQAWPRDPQELDSFYGNPRGIEGGANPAWEAENLVTFTFPWRIKGEQTYRIHKKVRDSLLRVLHAIDACCGHDQTKIESHHLHETGGTYVFRTNRNNPRALSNHSRGIAIDLAPDENPNRSPWVEDATHLPRFVIEAFKSEGWRWGGDFNTTKDAMHFEAVFDQHHDQPPVPAPKPGALQPQPAQSQTGV